MHRNIDVIEKKSTNQNPGGSIIVKCKDFRIYQLDINTTEDLNNVVLSLERLTSLGELNHISDIRQRFGIFPNCMYFML